MNQTTEGLIRRVKNRENTEGSSSSSSQPLNNNSNDPQEEDIDDCDSKETRLTLMEEVLLLGLKDKEVINKIVIFSLCTLTTT